MSDMISRASDKSLFERIDRKNIHDQAFETKRTTYLGDSLRRFAKNKGSVVAAFVILAIILYAIIVPLVSPRSYVDSVQYPNGFLDSNFSYCLPYNSMFAGTGFWDGTSTVTLGETDYTMRSNWEGNRPYIAETVSVNEETHFGETTTSYVVRIDSYAVGVKSVRMTPSQYQALRDYEIEQGIYGTDDAIIKPVLDRETYLTEYREYMIEQGATAVNADNVIDYMRTYYSNNAWIYYQLDAYYQGVFQSNHFEPVLVDGEVVPLYQTDESGEYVYYTHTTGTGSQYTVRVDYFDYFVYTHGFEPFYTFGSNAQGQDLFLRLAEGARFSLLIGIGISFINFIIGLIWGAVSGYYGGTVDLVMERITDVIGNVPSIVVLTICSVAFTSNSAILNRLGAAGSIIVSFLIAFVYSGWIGTASTTRMQFYRFKGQEYVLASRTLGAKDRRLIFRHILPNAAGTLVTSSVLMIPGVIFSETSLSYLGIVNFSTSGLVSIGSLLDEGQGTISTYPHLLMFPCILIALLMISFNLFGNGLRDAFNTTLKGSHD